jgi:hypothetical protein
MVTSLAKDKAVVEARMAAAAVMHCNVFRIVISTFPPEGRV